MVAHVCDAGTQEAEAEGLNGQSNLHRNPLSLSQKKKIR
jgi:hypothetical protein